MSNRSHQEGNTISCNLKGLDCGGCAAKIESRLRKELDPQAAVSFATSTLTIDSRQIQAAKAIIGEIEPHVTVIDNSEAEHDHHSGHHHHDHDSLGLGPLIASGLLFALGLIFRKDIAPMANGWGEHIVFIAAYIFVGRDVVMTAIRNAARGQIFDENFLMTIATMGAFAIGNLPEAVSVMLFYYVGEMLQGMAVARSRGSIQELLDIRPDIAHLVTDTGSTDVDPVNINLGDTILVRPGERVPLDGKVLKGQSFMDTSALTGESVPRRVTVGETILAGMVNNSGLLEVEVTKTYGETTLARILELVEHGASRKAPTEQFITKFARYYTPVVVAGAALIAIVPPLFIPGALFADWLHRALVLLVISCPCALVISIPLGYFGGIGGASRQGILVKGANFLDALADVDTVVFDKTGTLTEGVFQVQHIRASQGFTENEVLQLAAKAEVHSSHPIALSIMEATGYEGPSQEGDFQEISGKGMKVTIQGSEILVGNLSLLADHSIDTPKVKDLGTTVHVAKDGLYAGNILVADGIKATAAPSLHSLWHLGVKEMAMLSGDTQTAAENAAHQLGIGTVHAGLLPQDKVAKLEGIMAQKANPKGKLAFVGDGINDAPVLTRADVGIAMGGLGSDAAIEAADVVIMEDKLEKIGEAINIARHTRRIIIQNIAMAFAVKALFVALGVVGAASLWEAVFADVGVAILAVLNATRALRFQPKIKPDCDRTCGYRQRQLEVAS